MSFGLSVVVKVPSEVDRSAVISIGERYDATDYSDVPPEVRDEPMDVGEALQIAFTEPGGVADLARLGVTWEVYETGGKQ